MVQLFQIYHTAQEGCIFYGNMYNDYRKVIAVVHLLWGWTLVKGKLINITLSHEKASQVIMYFINLRLYVYFFFYSTVAEVISRVLRLVCGIYAYVHRTRANQSQPLSGVYGLVFLKLGHDSPFEPHQEVC